MSCQTRNAGKIAAALLDPRLSAVGPGIDHGFHNEPERALPPMFCRITWKARTRGASHEDAADKFAVQVRSRPHDVKLARSQRRDLVLIPAGSFPVTTSGKVSRATYVQYRQDQFARLSSDA